jgi:uncharacterized delta-60 repeat protein
MKNIVIISFILFQYLPVFSQNSGILDPTFGDAGMVITGDTIKYEGANSVAVQKDGKILVSGAIDGIWSLIRYQSNGDIDSTWGAAGILSDPDPGSFSGGEPMAIAIQQDGKILVGGFNANQFVMWRYLTEGVPDSSFGTSGYLNFTCGFGSEQISSIKIDTANKILIVGVSWNNTGTLGYYNHTVLARLNNDGSMDTTFGVNGFVMTELGFGVAGGRADIGIQSDGKIILSNKTNDGSLTSIAVRRFLYDGTTDNTFGNNGTTITNVNGYDESSSSLVIQKDNKIVVVGTSIDNCLAFKGSILLRLTRDGVLDNTFNSFGYVITMQHNADITCSVALQSDQRILVAKRINGGRLFVIERWNSDGSPDNTFGDAGSTTTSFDAIEVVLSSMVLQPDEKIILCGTLLQHTHTDIVVTRYNVFPLGIDNITEDYKIGIHPVPFKETVTISCPPDLVKEKPVLTIFSCDGKLLLNQTILNTSTSIPVNDLPSGTYFFRLNIKDQSIVRKVIK